MAGRGAHSRHLLRVLCTRSAAAPCGRSAHAPAGIAAALSAAGPCRAASAEPLLQQLALPWHGFACHYAKHKGKQQKGGGGGKRKAAAVEEEEDDDADEDEGDAPEFDPAEVEELMGRAVEYLSHELAGMRTGRANPGLLENIPVEAQGSHQPLRACAAVTVRGPQLLVVQVYDAQLVPAVARAIQESPLGIAPNVEGSELQVKLPQLTQTVVDKLVKMVAMEAEEAHQSIRRARQRGMDAVKKLLKEGSQDERKRAEKQVQQLHDKWMAEVKRLTGIKEKELREHKA